MNKGHIGVDLMNAINDGSIQKFTPEFIKEVRAKIVEACEELIEIGARIRPLFIDGENRGWVRCIHITERKQLQRWYPKQEDFAARMIKLGTSLSDAEVEGLTAVELARITRLMDQMASRDVSLFPYLSAFVTTSASEYLWHSRARTSFENKVVHFPDGKQITLLMPGDHARLWASLCTYREQAKKRVDENYNALMIIRPWVGNNATSVENSLKSISKSLIPDTLDPWMNVVQVDDPKFEDGWAHAEDDSVAGLQRHLAGMLENDRHERVMEAFEKQQREEAEKQRKKIDDLISRHEGQGIINETVEVLSAKEVNQRSKALRKGVKKQLPADFEETQASGTDRLSKYTK